jgi:Pentapeptide repeats (8 copies)
MLVDRGVEHWNRWRETNPEIRPNLFEAVLTGASLGRADLSKADLRGASLEKADLRRANLSGVDLYRGSLWRANLSNANLGGADLSSANLNGAILREANLRQAILRFARLTAADVSDSTLSGCFVYGCSLWNLKGCPKEQFNVVITPKSEPAITVDNIEVAQFIYLLLNNQKIRQVIDTLTSKVVLILGRFTPERKVVLDAIRVELRQRNYLPVLFDFEGPSTRDLTETVRTLAHMARFVIADITDAKSIPQELMAFVPNLPSVPVQPLLLASEHEYGMFEHLRRFPWVLQPVLYGSQAALLTELSEKVIAPAEAKMKEQTGG